MKMVDEEFITVEMKISRRSYGTEQKLKLKNIHLTGGENGLTPEFKKLLCDNYSIDIDELLEEFGDREDIMKLII